ncbi:hypothetical protein BDZ91DRAFT_723089 [Kalaharituber pfeilii]|nr:hypothetical protein BDZ91DRAFT_723089 [Kalaharituber pfeilii]
MRESSGIPYFRPLSGSYRTDLNHRPLSLTLSTSISFPKYTTTELVFFPSSSSIVLFLNQRIPLIFPSSRFAASSQSLIFPKSFRKAIPCITMPYFPLVVASVLAGEEVAVGPFRVAAR